jgi:hypothetical protein
MTRWFEFWVWVRCVVTLVSLFLISVGVQWRWLPWAFGIGVAFHLVALRSEALGGKR